MELVQLPIDPEIGHCKGFGFIRVSSVIDNFGVQDSTTKVADFDDDDGGGLVLRKDGSRARGIRTFPHLLLHARWVIMLYMLYDF
ncbi:hypothetical protein U1Q18_022646 [Sarracenia purpurea var. burkii]